MESEMDLDENEIQVVTPPVADETDLLENGLVTLTEAISQLDEESVAHGFLGGSFGYGAQYETPVFLMHPYCWCEQEDCIWCSEDACGCSHPGPRQFIDGKEVSGDAVWKWSDKLLGPMPHDKYEHGTPEYEAYSKEWDARVKERDRRCRTLWPARTHVCQPQGLMCDRPEGDSWKPRQSAPHFWHKPSGLRVWWYKWIGRDMEVRAPEGLDYQTVFAECLASLPAKQPA